MASSLAGLPIQHAQANAIVVAHDINTLGSGVAGAQEATFAVNVANFLTSDSAGKRLLLFESHPGDPTRNFAVGILSALMGSGFPPRSRRTTPRHCIAPAGWPAPGG